MRNKRQLIVRFNQLYLISLIIVLVGCIPATPTPPTPPTDTPTPTATVTPTDTPTPSPTPTLTATQTPTETPIPLPSVCKTVEPPQTQDSTNGYFLKSQMIVTGPNKEIDGETGVINQAAPNAVLLQICDLSFLSTLSFDTISPPTIEGKEESADWFFNSNLSQKDQRSDLSMRLYEFRDAAVPIEERISAVNEAGNGRLVFADPNYLTGLSQNPEPCFLPTGGGSGGGGRPFGRYGIPDPRVGPPIERQFMRQWAFGRQGVDLPASSSYSGAGIRVGVFDTAPSELPAWDPFPALPSDLDFGSIRDAVTRPEFPLSVDYLDGSDHGLFGAGLIHAAAPQAEIHLIRVLNDEGCGTSADLAQAIIEFIHQMGTTSEKGSMQNVVMNFSLGLSKPIRQPDQTDIEWEKLLKDFVAFETAIFEAQRLGAIIVAAAGNESTQNSVQNMVLPAAYNKIYGVAAINPDQDRSCFSNMGDIAAPGGDGGQKLTPTPNSNNDCASRSDTWDIVPLPPKCADMEGCRYGVISLSLRATGGPGYIFWAGTSFATPLVTGLAARTLEKASGNPIRADCLIRTGVVALPADPNLGIGRIDIAQSLASTCP